MKKRFGLAIVLAGLAAICGAQTAPAPAAKPNFAGTWKLNLQKSDLGQMAPTSEIDTITQADDQVIVAIASVRDQGPMNYTFAAKLDGTETPLAADAFPADSVFKILTSKAVWQGTSLVITQTSSFQDAKGTLISTFTISGDGKTLTKATHIVFDQAAFDSKSVYDKA